VRESFRVALDSLRVDMSASLESLGTRMKNAASKLTSHTRQTKASGNQAERTYKGQSIAMRTMASRLGTHLEAFAGGWFQHAPASKSYPGAEVNLVKKIGGPKETVSRRTEDVEIASNCARPLAVREVTSFLNADERGKVAKLGRLAVNSLGPLAINYNQNITYF
jgi:hypothetical protein